MNIGQIRAEIFAEIPRALAAAREYHKDRASGQLSLFDAPPPPPIVIEPEVKRVVFEAEPILPPHHLFPLDKSTGTRTCPRCGFVLGSGNGSMPPCVEKK